MSTNAPKAQSNPSVKVQKLTDPLYREIRIENTLEDAQGKKMKLKERADVDITVEADPKDTTHKGTSSK